MIVMLRQEMIVCRWESIMTLTTSLHVAQTHMRNPGTEPYCCVRASSKSRVLGGAPMIEFESRLLAKDNRHYHDRSIIHISIYSEPKSDCLYCNLGHMRCSDAIPQVVMAPTSIHITKATSAEGLIITFGYIGREIWWRREIVINKS